METRAFRFRNLEKQLNVPLKLNSVLLNTATNKFFSFTQYHKRYTPNSIKGILNHRIYIKDATTWLSIATEDAL